MNKEHLEVARILLEANMVEEALEVLSTISNPGATQALSTLVKQPMKKVLLEKKVGPYAEMEGLDPKVFTNTLQVALENAVDTTILKVIKDLKKTLKRKK